MRSHSHCRIVQSIALMALLIINSPISTALAQGTAFTYDGVIQKGTTAQTGNFNFTFTLFNVASGGTHIATPINLTGVAVKNGAFTVTLDFGGAVWNGQDVWLEVAVEGPSDSTFQTLSPRQQVLPTPYAIYAETANTVSGTLLFSQLTGTIENSQLANSSITINAGPGLSGGPNPVALGGAISLTNTGVTSLTGGDGVTVSGATGNLTLGLGSSLTLNGSLPAGINTPSGSLLYYDNLNNYFAGIGAGNPATTGQGNTATGTDALENNQNGSYNTANGEFALSANQSGTENTAVGINALKGNLSGNYNTAVGTSALEVNQSGSDNTATGNNALQFNETGIQNVGVGEAALEVISGGSYNTAVGEYALGKLGDSNPTLGGSNNIAIGYLAGSFYSGNESSNIDIGNVGVAGENNVIRIGDQQTAAYIAGVINGNGSGLVNLNGSQITGGTINNSQLAHSSITISPGPGLTGGGTVSLGGATSLGIATGGVNNSMLANSSITINTGTGLSGAGSPVALGGSITLNNTGVTSLTGSDGVTVSASTGAATLGLGSFLTLTGPSQVGVNTPNGPVLFFDFGNDNYFAGYQAGNEATTGTINTAAGDAALQFNTSGTANSAYGYLALGHNTIGSQNTAIGTGALEVNSTGSDNVAVGQEALVNNNASGNTACGATALSANTTGYYNVAIGGGALYANTNGYQNTAVGYEALYENITGLNNSAFGEQALFANTTGIANTATGVLSMYNNTNGTANTADGQQSLYSDQSGADNTAIGFQSLYSNTNSGNTAIGRSALISSTGNYNIGIGYYAGQSLTTGDYNIDIGNAGSNSDVGVIRIGTPGIHVTTSLAGICNSHVGYGCRQGTAGTVFGNTFNFWWSNNVLEAWVDNIDVGNIMFMSDRRLKENIAPMTDDALTRVMALKPSTFKYKTIPGTIFHGDGTQEEGFIADELQQIIPSAVNGEKDALTSKGTIQPQTVNLMPVVAVLTKAVQDQQKEIDELKAMVKTLSERK